MENINLGFLNWQYLDEQKTIRGGCLVTDLKTNPLEFRCTSPVRFTELQKILYGKNFDEYISQELVGSPLLKNMINQPHLIFVLEPVFLPLRKALKIPLCWLDKAQNPPKFKTDNSYPNDLIILKDVFEIYKNRPLDLIEPFERINHALLEAQRQGILESGR